MRVYYSKSRDFMANMTEFTSFAGDFWNLKEVNLFFLTKERVLIIQEVNS